MSTGKRNALGKGLSALLEDHGKDSPVNSTQKLENEEYKVGSINTIPLNYIETNPFQPRTEFSAEALNELAESIRLQGIIQPITVRRLNDQAYQLISGERRFRASKLAGLVEIPAYVRLANDQEMLEMALIENIQRENLNPLEVAISFQRMIDECKLKQDDLGLRVAKSRSTVSNYLRLLKLPPQIQVGLKENKISMGHAKALISIEESERQLWLFKQILLHDLSVRKTEELARHKGLDQQEKKNTALSVPHEMRKVQDDLSSMLGTRVHIRLNGVNGGKIEIPFLSTHDLNRILELIN